MQRNRILASAGAFVFALVAFFRIFYLDVLFSALGLWLAIGAVRGGARGGERTAAVALIALSGLLLLATLFQLVVRASELGGLPPL